MTNSRPLAEVAGANAKRLRTDAGVTLEQLAKAAQVVGLKWSAGKVGDFEGGRVSPLLPTLFALTSALARVTMRQIRLADLLESDTPIVINDRLTVAPDQLNRAVTGGPVEVIASDIANLIDTVNRSSSDTLRKLSFVPGLHDAYLEMTGEQLDQVRRDSGLTEQRIAGSLDLDRLQLDVLSLALWGRSFSAERDTRAGREASAQKRGRVSRELKAELQRAMSDGND